MAVKLNPDFFTSLLAATLPPGAVEALATPGEFLVRTNGADLCATEYGYTLTLYCDDMPVATEHGGPGGKYLLDLVRDLASNPARGVRCTWEG